MKKHNKFIIGIIVGLILSSVIGYAKTVLTSNEVVYDNTNSKLSSTNVKDAIDELNEKATTKLKEAKNSCPTRYECNPKRYFAYISGSFIEDDIRTQQITDYTTLGKKVFAFSDAINFSPGICIDDRDLFCIQENDGYDNSVEKLKKYFGEEQCTDASPGFKCESDSFFFFIRSDGVVQAINNDGYGSCSIAPDGSTIYCDE